MRGDKLFLLKMFLQGVVCVGFLALFMIGLMELISLKLIGYAALIFAVVSLCMAVGLLVEMIKEELWN